MPKNQVKKGQHSKAETLEVKTLKERESVLPRRGCSQTDYRSPFIGPRGFYDRHRRQSTTTHITATIRTRARKNRLKVCTASANKGRHKLHSLGPQDTELGKVQGEERQLRGYGGELDLGRELPGSEQAEGL